MFCVHDWKILSETVTVSKFESSISALDGISSGTGNLPPQLCCADRKHIQIVTCFKCGKLKRFVERI